MQDKTIGIVGAGLAGCEAAWQIAKAGYKVNLYEMKPKKFSKAHKSENFAELVCSNSLKAKRLESAGGLLKAEMENLSSLTVNCAKESQVEAGGALAVDRNLFSKLVTEKIKANKNINIINKEITNIKTDDITIIATGPLTSDHLAEEIKKLLGSTLSFYDAAAPIITAESIDMNKAYFASRYNKGEDNAYINCPLTKEEYELFYNELINAKRAPVHDFDVMNPKVYEGCMPVEIMAQRGEKTLLFGPLKPVGLKDPKTGKLPFAVVQLRQENKEKTLYNMVGFQSNLKFGEQKRVFSLIPALKNLEIIRYAVMHRNTFIDSPRVLNKNLSLKQDENIFFAGQITGVEGYMESASSGILAGINVVKKLENKPFAKLNNKTMIGALNSYITDESIKNFQPMGANFGIMAKLETKIKNKQERYAKIAQIALENILKLKEG